MMLQYSITKGYFDAHMAHLRRHIAAYVKHRQSSMSFHKTDRWADIEADEVTLAKRIGPNGSMEWASYLGVA